MARNRSKKKLGWISPKKEEVLSRRTLTHTDLTPYNAVQAIKSNTIAYK